MIATCASFGGLSAMADILKVNGQTLCSNTGAVSVRNNVYSIACRDGEKSTPVPSRPISNTPVPKPPAVAGTKCGVAERDLITEIFTGKGFEKAFILSNKTALAVPFNSGSLGKVRKLTFVETAIGYHFKKTIIISKCKGVYNPEDS